MTWEVRLLEGTQDRLQAAGGAGSQPAPGWLIGAAVDSTLAVLSSARCMKFLRRGAPTSSNPVGSVDEDREAADLQMLMPAGLRVLGAYGQTRSDDATAVRAVADALLAAVPAQQIDDRTPLIAAVAAGGKLCWFVQRGAGCEALELAAPLPASWLHDTHTLLRCHLLVRLDVFGIRPVPEDEDVWDTRQRVRSDALLAAVERASSELTSPSMVFYAQAMSSGPAMLYGTGTSGGVGGSLERPANLTPMVKASPTDTAPAAAPTLVWQPVKNIRGKEPVPWHVAIVHLDVLAYVRRDSSTAEAALEVVQPGICNQLQVFKAALDSGRNFCDEGVSPPPQRAFHFQPPGWAHAITVVYPLPDTDDADATAAAEAKLSDSRAQLHQRLGLPGDRPLLRAANALRLTPTATDGGGTSAAGRLSDVHKGLPPPGIVGGSVHLISGSYDYHHYMQDKFDDKGWGCAYRSLQTICSWFRRQHYTAAEPPSHRAIQTALVKLGDKEPAFIGSKQWVGAIELSYVLDSLLGVSSKIITVAKGSELPNKAREIAHHFDTQGTPIMMGGGVLAYTLLGIEFNAKTGEAAFLILDPHFTGADDLQRIHAGQWVAWKRPGDKAAAGGDLFVQNAFYNLLCPQRPAGV